MAQSKRKEKDRPQQESAGAGAPVAQQESTSVARPDGLSRTGWIILGLVVLVIQAPLIHYFFFRGVPDAPVSLPHSEDFSSPERLKENFFSTGGLWRIEDGWLKSPGVRNNPLWLKASLPQNVAVEFDVKSLSPEGDIKVELFGDGTDHASGYIFIHGGWNNSLSIIARLDEHGKSLRQLEADAQRRAQQLGLPNGDLVATGVFKPDTGMRVEANPYKVEIGRTYRWRIERRGGLITWTIDGQPFMEFNDPFPLTGKKHDRLGFSSWDATLLFDNLKIEAL